MEILELPVYDETKHEFVPVLNNSIEKMFGVQEKAKNWINKQDF